MNFRPADPLHFLFVFKHRKFPIFNLQRKMPFSYPFPSIHQGTLICRHLGDYNPRIIIEGIFQNGFTTKVSLAIRGGYVPREFGIHEYQNYQFKTKTTILLF